MEKIDVNKNKWSYRKAAAYSGTLGLIVAVVFTIYNLINGVQTETWGGLIGGTVGQFFLIILCFVVIGVLIFTLYRIFRHIRLDVCIGCIIAGVIITVIGLYAAFGGFPGATWEIMGSVIQPQVWSWPFAIFGVILLLIGVIITYFSLKKK